MKTPQSGNNILHRRKESIITSKNELKILPHDSDSASDALYNDDITYLLGVTTVTFATLYGFLYSVQSFACLPYGNSVYHLTLILSNIFNTLVCFIMLIPALPKPTTRMVTLATGLGLLLTGYAGAAALMSPEPPLKGTVLGQVILVSSMAFVRRLITLSSSRI
jgi:riboflavin transporter 2